MYDLHVVHDPTTYLRRMQISAARTNVAGEIGLSGDTFCIHWLGRWLKLPICIYSLTHRKPYLHFNIDASHPLLSILFHDSNPIAVHYEIFFQGKVYTMPNKTPD